MFAIRYVAFLICLVACDTSTIPSYIPVCKRNDPNIEDCIVKAIEVLKPKLVEGIPELDIPALEPLIVPELVVSRGDAFKAVCKNVVVRDASNFKVNKLKADVNNINYDVSVTIPSVHIFAEFDVDAKILNVKFAGKGNFKANATNAEADVILKGKKVKRDGETYVDFTNLDINMKIEDYTVQLDNIINGNKEFGDAISLAVNENKKDFFLELKPLFENVLEKLFLDVARKITYHFKYDDLFPEK